MWIWQCNFVLIDILTCAHVMSVVFIGPFWCHYLLGALRFPCEVYTMIVVHQFSVLSVWNTQFCLLYVSQRSWDCCKLYVWQLQQLLNEVVSADCIQTLKATFALITMLLTFCKRIDCQKSFLLRWAAKGVWILQLLMMENLERNMHMPSQFMPTVSTKRCLLRDS